jgi:hypothetical protein
MSERAEAHMSGRWWRAYDQAVDDPKLQRLAPPLFRAWFNLMCVASANGGTLPAIGDVAFKLHVSEQKAGEIVAALVAAGLIDRRPDGKLEPHNWQGRQFRSDIADPTNAERQKRYRDRHRVTDKTVTPTVTLTPPRDREQNPDAETEKDEARAGARYSREFEDQVWRPYPRTPVMSKPEAWKAWQKADAADRAAIVAAVPRYAAWLKAKPDHPVVHACRFIAQRRFEGFGDAAAPAEAALVAIAPGTPEWDAWWAHYGAHKNAVGKSFGQTRMRQAREAGQPHLERSPWPPGHAPRPDELDKTPHD